MALPQIDTTRAPEVLLGDIRAYVVQAEALVDAGDAISLQGLDKAVEALCTRILALPKEEGKPYQEKLGTLMDEVERLQTKMIRLQEEIAATMKSLTTQKRAARAYINAPKVEE